MLFRPSFYCDSECTSIYFRTMRKFKLSGNEDQQTNCNNDVKSLTSYSNVTLLSSKMSCSKLYWHLLTTCNLSYCKSMVEVSGGLQICGQFSNVPNDCNLPICRVCPLPIQPTTQWAGGSSDLYGSTQYSVLYGLPGWCVHILTCSGILVIIKREWVMKFRRYTLWEPLWTIEKLCKK